MRADRLLVRRHFVALCTEGEAQGITPDLVGRLLLDEIIMAWRATRSSADIASELEFAKTNLDSDQEYPFIRP